MDRLLSVFRHFSLLLLFLYTYVAVLVNGKLKLKLSIILYNNNITYMYMYVHFTTVLHYKHACTSRTFVYIRTFSRLKPYTLPLAENDAILTQASVVLLNFIVSLIYLVLNIHVLVHAMCP